MKFVYFTHSVMSCWNHGNAHFLRGILTELRNAGHDVVACEPATGWSRENLVRDHGEAPLLAFRQTFPETDVATYESRAEAEALADNADVIVVHEWTDPGIVSALGRLRRYGGSFQLYFHDTHHRAVSDPGAARKIPIDDYDGVLAFGESLASVYRDWGWGSRVHVWHEAADTNVFLPLPSEGDRDGIVWIGNWGDDERTAELDEYLLRPAADEGLKLDVHGVRYPKPALIRLAELGASYRGWLPNHLAPKVFAEHICTIHVPRRFYTEQLPGIPTIRMFEAMACGIPLICAPWADTENLFREGIDYLAATDGAHVRSHLRALSQDRQLREGLQRSALARIRERHTCRHRVRQLFDILKLGNVLEPSGEAVR